MVLRFCGDGALNQMKEKVCTRTTTLRIQRSAHSTCGAHKSIAIQIKLISPHFHLHLFHVQKSSTCREHTSRSLRTCIIWQGKCLLFAGVQHTKDKKKERNAHCTRCENGKKNITRFVKIVNKYIHSNENNSQFKLL